MAQSIENNLTCILDGKYFDEQVSDLCDWTVELQNRQLDVSGTIATPGAGFTPILGKSITYIVACVLINDDNEVLMMQEAKQSCAGSWYLPAGRMEKGESIKEAAIREVYEETGLNVEITTLLSLECVTGSWFRFVVTGRIIGGELKTPAKADKESLQAKWIRDLNELSLRANDIKSVIEIGREYKNRIVNRIPWHSNMLPIEKSHQKNYLRIIAIIKERSTNTMHTLLSKNNRHHFPVTEIHPSRSLHSTLRKFLIELLGADLPQHRPHGILSIEHCASSLSTSPSDGICINLLVPFRPALEDIDPLSNNIVEWFELTKNMENRLITILSSKNTSLNLNVRH